MDKIVHCELTSEYCILTFDSGKYIKMLKLDAILLAMTLIHYKDSESADISDIVTGKVVPGKIEMPSRLPNLKCKSCGPLDWKPTK